MWTDPSVLDLRCCLPPNDYTRQGHGRGNEVTSFDAAVFSVRMFDIDHSTYISDLRSSVESLT